MRATRAYITGFGTTGLLIASALLTMLVMSAFVAFNGFPGQDVQDPIGTLLLQERQTPVNVPAKPVHVRVLSARQGPASSRAGRATIRRLRAPQASTGPVQHRTSVQPPTQSPGTAPGSTSGQGAALVPQETAPVTPTTPQVPQTELPPLTLPSLPSPPPPQPPSGSPQLPIDTSGVTSLLGGG